MTASAKSWGLPGLVLAPALLLVACSAADDSISATATTSADQPAVESSAPSPSGLPTIAFDPCAEISDELVRQFGFDPAGRSREQGSIGMREVNACNFHTDHRGLSVIAQNRPWEELPSTLSTTPHQVTVNGREALFAVDAVGSDSCAILMRTGFGAVIIDSVPFRGGDADPTMHACDGIWAIAEAVEPLIGS